MPFSFDPAEVGTITNPVVVVYEDRTDVVVHTNNSPTVSEGVISSPVPEGLKAELVYRVHFRFTVGASVFDYFRRVVIEK